MVVAIVAGAGLFWLSNQSQTNSSNPLYTVQRGSISSVVRSTGKVEASQSVRLSFKLSETVRKIYVQPGDFVPAGTLLIELDPTSYQHQLEVAMAQRDIARFQLSAVGEKAQATVNLQPAPTPTPTPVTQPVKAVTPLPALPAAPSELYAAAKQADIAEEGVRDAQLRLDNTKLYAAFDGTVLSVDTNEGESIGPGQAVLTLANLGNLRVRADIDEIDIANVVASEKASFTLDAFPGQNFEGRVQTITPNAVPKQGSTIYQVLISFAAKPNLTLRPGMSVNVAITSQSKDNIIVVPSRAIESIGPRKYVNVVGADGSSSKVEVQTGISNGTTSEILSGLQPGQQIK